MKIFFYMLFFVLISPVLFSADVVVDQSNSDLSVRKAYLDGFINGQTDPQSGPSYPYSIDLSTCKEMRRIAYDANRAGVELDCTSVIEKKIGKPLIHPAIVTSDYQKLGKFLYNKTGCDYGRYKRGEMAQEEINNCFAPIYYAEYFNCTVAHIQVAIKKAAFDTASAVGFYSNNWNTGFQLIEKKRLVPSADPDSYIFGAITRCWAGTMSSSEHWSLEFKPFLQFITADKIYRNWDLAEKNYRLYKGVESFEHQQ
ncbi:MAG: hypothetical protein WCG27_06750 [Pseudomonadota bacterium]